MSINDSKSACGKHYQRVFFIFFLERVLYINYDNNLV